MNSAVLSGLFELIGTALGWVLGEVGVGWRSSAERRWASEADADARVLNVARVALAFSEGARYLVQVDVVKRQHGEGVSRDEYSAKALALPEQLQQLRLALLEVQAKGPDRSRPEIVDLQARVRALWDDFAGTSRSDIADEPERFNRACDQIAAIAERLVSQP
jgi:hypothetical protein